MLKRIKKSELEKSGLKISADQYKSESEMWESQESLQSHLDNITKASIPVFSGDKKEYISKTVYLKGGGKGTATWLITRQGEPDLIFSEEHISDATWDYKFISKKLIAGPVGDYISQAESVKAR